MPETPVSLLERLRLGPDGPAWKRLVDLYGPLIQGWLRRQGVTAEDGEDLSQEVLAVLVRELPHFEHDGRPGAFRRWLRTIVVNRLRGFWRAKKLRPAGVGGDFGAWLEQLAGPDSDLARAWDLEHDRHVARRLLAALEPEFAPSTWEAFCRVTLGGEPAAEVARALGLSVNAVWIAKSRVLQRLRQEARGLID